ncbi:conserved domain protein [Actinomyces sp. oral taxon 170 str. F0386]|nr:conserved domain protein [Actinomyces sp. oral taxon 170 str. F0386]
MVDFAGQRLAGAGRCGLRTAGRNKDLGSIAHWWTPSRSLVTRA